MRPRLLYISPKAATFVRNDLRMLSDSFEVRAQIYPWATKWKTPFLLLRQAAVFKMFLASRMLSALLGGKLAHRLGLWHPEYVIISFPGFWSMWPVFFKRLIGCRVHIILNGTDSCAYPELGYGDLRKPHLKRIIGYSLGGADGLMPVSKSLLYHESTYYASPAFKAQGVRAHFPKLSTPACVIPNGIDPDFWNIRPDFPRTPNRVITVLGPGQTFLKGVELMVAAASNAPHLEFYIAGIDELPSHSQSPHFAENPTLAHLPSLPSNVHFLGRCTPLELRQHYRSSQYYFQLSYFEGFGVALVEAMACGCIPVVSTACSLPETSGARPEYLLQQPDLESVNKLIADLPTSPADLDRTLNVKVSAFAHENYTFAQRKEAIEKFIVRQECRNPSVTSPS